MIQIDNVRKEYKNQLALDNVSVRFQTNTTTAVLGPNGSGKTTLLKCILGLVKVDEGNIQYNNTSIKGQYTYRKDFGYLPQIAHFPENSKVSDLIQFMSSLKSSPSDMDKLIQLFDLDSELNKKMKELSGGNKQKVNLVIALSHDAPVIILDEPSNGLDPLSLKRLKEYIEEEKTKGKNILLTTHIMSLAQQLADNILFMLEGKVYFDGTLKQLLEKEEEKDLESAIAKILERNE